MPSDKSKQALVSDVRTAKGVQGAGATKRAASTSFLLFLPCFSLLGARCSLFRFLSPVVDLCFPAFFCGCQAWLAFLFLAVGVRVPASYHPRFPRDRSCGCRAGTKRDADREYSRRQASSVSCFRLYRGEIFVQESRGGPRHLPRSITASGTRFRSRTASTCILKGGFMGEEARMS